MIDVSESPRGDDAGLRIGAFNAAIFDLDGVVRRTARVHAASWKQHLEIDSSHTESALARRVSGL